VATILLIEDNELNRDMLTRRLSRHGYQVLTAVDGVQGIEMVRTAPPDLVLLDMSLPKLDGWQVAMQIRSTPETCMLPVIALTAHAIAGDRQKALDAGCDDYEAKPVNFARLLDKINAFLERKGP
jgi:two-component system cell cycle response regulator DivK